MYVIINLLVVMYVVSLNNIVTELNYTLVALSSGNIFGIGAPNKKSFSILIVGVGGHLM